MWFRSQNEEGDVRRPNGAAHHFRDDAFKKKEGAVEPPRRIVIVRGTNDQTMF